MQSFIINIPEEKVDFFLELAAMLDFEVLEMEEDEQEDEPATKARDAKKKPSSSTQSPQQTDDPFLDWEAERKNARKNKY